MSFHEILYSSKEHMLKDCDLELVSEANLYGFSKGNCDSLKGPVTHVELLTCME